MTRPIDRRLSVAPMMDWTDRHERYFLRLLSPRALLYTEMVPTGAILHGDRARFLAFDPLEHPVALQLGGSDPGELARCAEIGAAWGYDEINLNVGCPSDRVARGRFGACLMAEPELVAGCVAAMRRAVDVPVTVKCRIGIDARESYADFRRFVDVVAAAGCTIFAVHARRAVLGGLSPKENREIPPLRHELVHRLKGERPELTVVINGGVRSVADVRAHLAHVDGVMIGREAYQNPYLLAEIETALLGAPPPAGRHELLESYLPYVEARRAQDVPLNAMARHTLGLFQGLRGARAWRRLISERAREPGAGAELLRAAASLVERPGA